MAAKYLRTPTSARFFDRNFGTDGSRENLPRFFIIKSLKFLYRAYLPFVLASLNASNANRNSSGRKAVIMYCMGNTFSILQWSILKSINAEDRQHYIVLIDYRPLQLQAPLLKTVKGKWQPQHCWLHLCFFETWSGPTLTSEESSSIRDLLFSSVQRSAGEWRRTREEEKATNAWHPCRILIFIAFQWKISLKRLLISSEK